MSETAKRETWRDWCAPDGFGAPGRPNPELLTRAELLALVEGWGVEDITDRTLRYWTKEGVIPPATVEGMPGKERALYPWWVADLIADVRRSQRRGMTLQDLTALHRTAAWMLSRHQNQARRETPPSVTPDDGDNPPLPIPSDVEQRCGAITAPLNRFADLNHQLYGLDVSTIEIHFRTGTGAHVSYVVPRTRRGDGGSAT